MSKPVEILFFDKPRHLRFTFNSISDMEAYMGCGLGQIFEPSRQGFQTARVMLCYGLRHEDRNMTVEKAGGLLEKALMNGVPLEKILETLMEAFTNSGLFKMSEPSEENPNGEQNSDPN